jgi:hypothetical protein
VVGHHNHIDHSKKRLFFIRFIAQTSTEFQITEAELGKLYAIMAKDRLFDTDADNFLLWCKHTCDQQTQSNVMLDMEAVGHLFT